MGKITISPCVRALECRTLFTTLTLDSTFGASGTVTSTWGDAAVDVAIDASDRPVVIGDGGRSLVRYTASGSVDSTFPTVSFASSVVADDVEIQGDGRIVVATRDAGQLHVMRFTASGSVDPSFDEGTSASRLAIVDSQPVAMALDPGGGLVIAATGQFTAASQQPQLVRMNAGGVITSASLAPFVTATFNRPTDVAITSDGQILVLGNISATATTTALRPYLQRMDDVSSVDETFGASGTGTVYLNPSARTFTRAESMVVSSDGYFVAGTVQADATLWDVTPGGTLATNFGTGGKVSAGLDSSTDFHDIALRDGRLFVVGQVGEAGQEDHLLGIYLTSGAPDTFFDTDGLRGDDIAGGRPDVARAIAFDSQGRLITAGSISWVDQTSSWLMTRYTKSLTPYVGTIAGTIYDDANGNGTINIGERGVAGRTVWVDLNHNGTRDAADRTATTSSTGTYTIPNVEIGTYAVQQVVPSGFKYSFSQNVNNQPYTVGLNQTTTVNFATVAVTPAVGLDPAAGNQGRTNLVPPFFEAFAPDGTLIGIRGLANGTGVIERYSATTGATLATLASLPTSNATAHFWILQILVRPDGRFLLIGDQIGGGGIGVMQFNPDGSPDKTFGVNGEAMVFAGSHASSDATLGPDGRLFVHRLDTDSQVIAITPTGTLDKSYGVNGVGVVPHAGFVNFGSIAVDAAGRVYVLYDNAGVDSSVSRLTSRGQLDTTFGIGGTVLFQLPSPNLNRLVMKAAAFTSDGKIVVAGSSWYTQTERQKMAAIRLNENGSIDTSFGQAGYAVVAFQRQGVDVNSSAIMVRVDANDAIVMAGLANVTVSTDPDIGLARLTAAGTLDSAWGNAGRRTAAVGISDDRVWDMRLLDHSAVQVVAHYRDANGPNNLATLTWLGTPSITGQIWNDTDGNGRQGPDEFGIAGRSVFLDADNDGTLDAGEAVTTTAADGGYRFIDVPVGTQHVRQILPARWGQTFPSLVATTPLTLNLAIGQQLTAANLGTHNVGGPAVLSSAFEHESALAYDLEWEENVAASLSADDIVVTDILTNAPLSTDWWTMSVNASHASISFAPTMPAGTYRVTIAAMSVASSSGVLNPTALAFAPFDFVGADLNRDRTVDFDDLLILARNYGTDGKTFSQGNVDYSADGSVDFNDLLILARRYGTTLTVPTTAAGVSIAPTTGRKRTGTAAADVIA